MRHLLQFESYTIKKVDREKEIHFIVMKGFDYQFTLVPGYAGFELSAKDKELDIDVDQNLIDSITNYILNVED